MTLVSNKSFIAFISALLSVLLSTGCTTARPMEKGLSPAQIEERINLGDEIIIQTRDSVKHKVRVESIDSKEIWGGGKVYPYENIVEINTKEHSAIKSGIATGVGLVAVYTAGFVLAFALVLAAL